MRTTMCTLHMYILCIHICIKKFKLYQVSFMPSWSVVNQRTNYDIQHRSASNQYLFMHTHTYILPFSLFSLFPLLFTSLEILFHGSEVKWSEVKSVSCVRLSATPWTVAYQAPTSMGFSRQEYWSGLSSPSPGIFPTLGLNPGLLHCGQMLYRLSHQGSPFHGKRI